MTAQKQKANFILAVALAIALSGNAAWAGFGDDIDDPADLTPMMLDNPAPASAIHLPVAPVYTAVPAPAAGVRARLATNAKCSALNPCAMAAPAIDHIAPEPPAQAPRR